MKIGFFGNRAVHGGAQSRISRVREVRTHPIEDVSVADLGVGVRESKGASRSRHSKGGGRAERVLRTRLRETEGEADVDFHGFVAEAMRRRGRKGLELPERILAQPERFSARREDAI